MSGRFRISNERAAKMRHSRHESGTLTVQNGGAPLCSPRLHRGGAKFYCGKITGISNSWMLLLVLYSKRMANGDPKAAT